MGLRAVAIALLLAGGVATGASGQALGRAGAVSATEATEAIESFDVTIDVRPGGEMVVREQIAVRALGQQIRRGIFRDFPTTFPRRFGLGRIEAPFDVLAVTRDGEPEPYRVEGIGDGFGRGGVRVRIGRADVMLEPRTHVYQITYRTHRWVRFGPDDDQLYWNVTGNGWAFPIERASATVQIAGLETSPVMESWTGPDGSTEGAAIATWDGGSGTARFETTEPLGAREGLTVRLTFPTGQLEPPSEAVRDQWFRLDWGGYLDAGYVVLFVIAVYLLMWRRVGIDPAPGPVRMRTEPPEGFSPAELGYIEARGHDDAQLSAALVNIALKGGMRIEQDESSWTLHRLSEAPEGLAPAEKKLFDGLLGQRSTIELEQSRHTTLRSAIKAFQSSLKRRLEQIYFVKNRRWFFAGLAISVAGFGLLALRWGHAINPVAWFLGLWLTGWTAGTGTLVYRIVQMARAARRTGSTVGYVGVGGLALFAVPFVFAEILVFGFLVMMVPTHMILAAIAIGATNVVFYHLLERPTLKGRGVLNEIDGFRRWLRGADREVVESDRSLAVFERHLPFAIALGLESEWTEAFTDVLDKAMSASSPAGAGALPWYYTPHHHGHGHGHRGFNAQAFSSSIGSSLASTLSSSSSAPASSGSGGGGFSSGGGSSGGGGGGGGGGGW